MFLCYCRMQGFLIISYLVYSSFGVVYTQDPGLIITTAAYVWVPPCVISFCLASAVWTAGIFYTGWLKSVRLIRFNAKKLRLFEVATVSKSCMVNPIQSKAWNIALVHGNKAMCIEMPMFLSVYSVIYWTFKGSTSSMTAAQTWELIRLFCIVILYFYFA